MDDGTADRLVDDGTADSLVDGGMDRLDDGMATAWRCRSRAMLQFAGGVWRLTFGDCQGPGEIRNEIALKSVKNRVHTNTRLVCVDWYASVIASKALARFVQ